MVSYQVVLFFVALFVGVGAKEEGAPSVSQAYIQEPRVFTSDSAVQRRDLEGEDPDGAGAGLELDKPAPQKQVFDHVGQKFVRKALDVLDQRLLDAAEAKRKGDDGDEVDDADDEDDNIIESGGDGFNADNDEEEEVGEHQDFDKIENEPSGRRKVKAKKQSKKQDKEEADLMRAVMKYPEANLEEDEEEENVQPPLRRKQKRGNKSAKHVNGMPAIDDQEDEAPIHSQLKAQRKRAVKAGPPQQMIPVDLNVNEGIEGEAIMVPHANVEVYRATSLNEDEEESSGYGTPHFGMVGSAAAGVGVIGSVAYCCVSRRRNKKHHSRSELPMYEPSESPSQNASTPDGYRVRRGLTKYR